MQHIVQNCTISAYYDEWKEKTVRRGVLILAGLVILVLAGGALTAGLGASIPTIIQSTDPNASPFAATPEQANLLLFWIGFVIFNLLGAGITIMALFWFLNRQVKIANEMPNRAERIAQEETDALGEGQDANALPEAAS